MRDFTSTRDFTTVRDFTSTRDFTTMFEILQLYVKCAYGIFCACGIFSNLAVYYCCEPFHDSVCESLKTAVNMVIETFDKLIVPYFIIGWNV